MRLFEKLKHICKNKIFLGILIFCVSITALAFFNNSQNFTAGILPERWSDPLSGVPEFFRIPEGGNAVTRIKGIIWNNFVPIFKYLMVAVSMLYAVLYLIQMITSSGNEETISTARKNILWQFLGFLIIALAVDVAEAFDPFVNNGVFVNKQIVDDSQHRLIAYMQLLAGVIAIFYIFFAGFRLITAAGDEEIINDQKNHIKWGFLGLMFVMLSDVVVNSVFYPHEGTKGLGREELTVLFSEGAGLLKFFLAFTGILALISVIASGVAYITSFGDEGATEKAKKTIIGSLIAVVIIVSAYILVSSFIPPGPPQV